jgi:hypothetical protein
MAQDSTAAAETTADIGEAEELASFLEERGIDVTTSGSRPGSAYEGTVRDPDDPDDEGEEEEPESIPTAAAPEEQEAKEEEQEALDPRAIAFRLREKDRQVAALAAEIQQRDQWLNGFITAMQRGGEAPANGAPAPAPEEPPPDLFVDPDGYVDHRLRHALGPVVQELERVKAENARLSGERQQDQDQQQFQGYVGQVRELATAYEAENPGYYERLSLFGEEYRQGLVSHGWDAQEAHQAWVAELGAMTNAAMQRGQNPAAFIDYHARRYTGQAAAPAAAPQRQDGQIAAARRAQASGVTRRSGAPAEGELTLDRARRSGVTPEQAAQTIRTGGRTAFLAMMREAERRR